MTPPSQTRPATLAGKVAIVTGASRGIGREIVYEFSKRGAKVCIVYTSSSSEKPSDQLIADVVTLENGSQAIKVQADLRHPGAYEHIISETVKAFGPNIDILVNNAGVELVKELKDTTAEDLAWVFDLNLTGVFLMTKAVLPHLRRPGRIINISSVGARSGFSKFTAYAASKAGLEGFTRTLAPEIGPQGHTVNAVAPGPVESDMLANIPKDLVAMQASQTPVENRIGTAEDVALIVAWLAGEDSQWVSGQTISASGGYLKI